MDPSEPGPARGFPHPLGLTRANNATCFINTGGQAWILLRAQHRSEWWGRAEGLLAAPTTRAQGLSWEGAGIGALALKSSLHEGWGRGVSGRGTYGVRGTMWVLMEAAYL